VSKSVLDMRCHLTGSRWSNGGVGPAEPGTRRPTANASARVVRVPSGRGAREPNVQSEQVGGPVDNFWTKPERPARSCRVGVPLSRSSLGRRSPRVPIFDAQSRPARSVRRETIRGDVRDRWDRQRNAQAKGAAEGPETSW